MIARDGAATSLWQQGMEPYIPQNKAVNNFTYDVAIIGGGITGISTAWLLQKAGKKCIVIEARNIGFGTTGGTTAHLNTLMDTPYATISSNFGEDNAKLIADAAKNALELIRQNIKELQIDCGFEEASAFVFSQNEKQTKDLKEVHDGSKKAGLSVTYTNNIPLDIPFEKAIRVEGQAKFHPLRYVYALAEAFEQGGGVIVQGIRVKDISDNDIAEIIADTASYKAKAVVFATHIPIGVNLLHLRCAPYRTYAMAVELTNKKSYPKGLIYDSLNPYHYYRTQKIDEKEYLIVGGYDHNTAGEENTQKCLLQLEAHIRTYFKVKKIAFAWSSQYFEPTDGLPYIGHLPGHSSNILVATGFGGNGMTYSSIAAMVLTHILTGVNDPVIHLLDPNRIKPVAGFVNFIKNNTAVAGSLLSKLWPSDKLTELSDMAHGESLVVNYEGKKLALHKDENGNIHALHPDCTHMKCTVAWNQVEQSWDCPCHGARFTVDGEILNGPATIDLTKINLAEKKEQD